MFRPGERALSEGMGGKQEPMYGLAEDLNRNGGGKGCGGSNGQLTGSNGCAMDMRNGAPELGAARHDETALVLQWDGRTVRMECTGQELRVAIAGPGMLSPECDIPMGISIT